MLLITIKQFDINSKGKLNLVKIKELKM